MHTQKILPFLWFDSQAEDAAAYYTSIFHNSAVGKVRRFDAASAEVSGQPEGSAMTVEFDLEGLKFVGLNGGPIFQFTPATSFFVQCASTADVEKLWEKLSAGGEALMPLDKYPFSEKYGWTKDKFGLSWQVSIGEDSTASRSIHPSLLFVGAQAGRAEEAMKKYTSLLPDSSIGLVARYEEGEGANKAGSVKYGSFTLAGQTFSAMDSHDEHTFTFTEAVSFNVSCKDQEEVDLYWAGLSAHPDSEQCGWLKDEFGVSWQIVPDVLEQLLNLPDQQKVQKVTEAMLQMKKIDVAGLEAAAK